jgi:hypothetical protein
MGEPSGAALFARYAHPPNELGYCGPEDFVSALSIADVDGSAVAERARRFEGAWPYLEVIASAAGVADPVDAHVVEAYWVGNGLLDRVAPSDFGTVVEHSFRGQPVAHGVDAGHGLTAVPHHSFHVFAVYPWVRMLAGAGAGKALEVLDRCRIRWGRVALLRDQEAVVLSRHLLWDGRSLTLGRPETEHVRWLSDGWTPLESLSPGDWVSMHWGGVCDRLSGAQLGALRSFSARQLVITNSVAPWRVQHAR